MRRQTSFLPTIATLLLWGLGVVISFAPVSDALAKRHTYSAGVTIVTADEMAKVTDQSHLALMHIHQSLTRRTDQQSGMAPHVLKQDGWGLHLSQSQRYQISLEKDQSDNAADSEKNQFAVAVTFE